MSVSISTSTSMSICFLFQKASKRTTPNPSIASFDLRAFPGRVRHDAKVFVTATPRIDLPPPSTEPNIPYTNTDIDVDIDVHINI